MSINVNVHFCLPAREIEKSLANIGDIYAKVTMEGKGRSGDDIIGISTSRPSSSS